MIERWMFSWVFFQRFFRSSFLLFFISLFCFQLALTATPNGSEMAGQRVEKFLVSLIDVATSDEPRTKRNIKFRKLFWRDCDMDRIVMSLLDRNSRLKWKQAKPGQRRAFTEALTDHYVRELSGPLAKMKGYRISIMGVREKNGYYEVRSSATGNGNKNFVKWRLSKNSNGEPRVFDLLVSGFSVIKYKRPDVGKLVHNLESEKLRQTDDEYTTESAT